MEQLAINSLRILSVDAIEKANSGHPGLPLGAAGVAYELWFNHMKHSPKNARWIDRDRFVLSAGHGSMLLYSLLHMFEYGLTIEDLKNFRQLNSKTPGHPEYGHTVGVETTTGPLGAGVAEAVGMAMAEAHLGAIFNKPDYKLFDHYTYVMLGDGCLMEGVAAEALSLAGTLKLNKLILLYDSNDITIEGKTEIAFKENVKARFEAYGFNTLYVEDANDLNAVAAAIEKAKSSDRPTLIEIRSQIGYGSPLAGTSKAHSDAMGAENVKQLRANLNWPEETPFVVPQSVYNHYHEKVVELNKNVDAWENMLQQYLAKYPEMKDLWNDYFNSDARDLYVDEEFYKQSNKAEATRNASGKILNQIKTKYPNLFGGSADLGPSNKTTLSDEGWFGIDGFAGRNIHFGVRENGMGAICNGIAVHGGLRPYCATFFVFTDFLKPMMRLASLMNVPVLYVMTHDSIGVGEDGPTHEPIEQLSMLRAQPNMYVFRPADANETAAGYALWLNSQQTPVTLVLSRQNLDPVCESGKAALYGAYVVSEAANNNPEGVLIASGSEVGLALKAQAQLAAENVFVRVVSMPCQELFLEQEFSYQEEVLPAKLTKRLAIEAGATTSWYRFVGLNGAVIGLDRFGASGKAADVFNALGFNVDNVVTTYKNLK